MCNNRKFKLLAKYFPLFFELSAHDSCQPPVLPEPFKIQAFA